jgi:hypothetical protein
MAAPTDHLSHIGTPYLDFEDEARPLLDLCDQNFIRRFNQLSNHKLEEVFHRQLLPSDSRSLLPGFQNHTRNSCTGLSAVFDPVIHSVEIQREVISDRSWIVIANRLNKFPVPRTSFVSDYHPVIGSVLRSFSS